MEKFLGKFYINSIIFAVTTFLMLFTVACESPEEPIKRESGDMTVLVYAVVADLNISADKREILNCAPQLDLDNNNVLIYEVRRTGSPILLKLRKTGSVCAYDTIKIYDRDLYSTDPRRISAVISDTETMAPADNYGIFFWSHATGWTPSFSTHGDSGANSLPMLFSFGSDKDINRDPNYTDSTDIDELADAIPNGMFRFIWFDACYMAGIEVCYQLRDKCDFLIAPPTEDPGNGIPYNLCLPYLLRKEPDVVTAAEKFFEYYESGKDDGWNVATIAVCKMSEIEAVADYCRSAYADAVTPSPVGMQIYHRGKNGPFYDFGQYTSRMASSNPLAPDLNDFKRAMSKFVIYKAATASDFAGRPIDQDNYSGLSCELYNPANRDNATEYYRSLDWFKRVYE